MSSNTGSRRARRPLDLSKVCRLFNTAAGCHFGAACKFLHPAEANDPLSSQPRVTTFNSNSGDKSAFIQWRYFLPKPNTVATQLLGPRLPKFLQATLQLIETDTGTMQEVIKMLASEGGLTRIKEVVVRNFDLSERDGEKLCLTNVFPFFRIITHTQVAASIMLEDHLGTIYNFLYGRQGERVVALFTFLVQVLLSTGGDDDENELCSQSNLEASLKVLSGIVEWNSNALVNPELKAVVESLLGNVRLQKLNNPHILKVMKKLGRRLEIGQALPEASSARKPAKKKAAFNIPVDLPGHLSINGARHDNDDVDISQIQILPTSDEVQSGRGEYLPSQDSSKWHLPPLEGLLDRHFRLLREDTVGQLRDAIRSELGQAQEHVLPLGARVFNYRTVVVEGISFSRWKSLQILISFEQPERARKKASSQARKEWWQQTKRLQNDALVCLLTRQGVILFCIVCEIGKPTQNSSRIQDASNQQRESHNLFDNSTTAFLNLQILDPSEENVNLAFDWLQQRNIPHQKLIEFPGVVMPSFHPTLQALQKMSQTQELSFAELVAPEGESVELDPPFYAIRSGFHFNLKDVVHNQADLYFKPGEEFDRTSFKAQTHLDSAQADALIECLSRSLALVQGPPGTGKSFTGVALIKVLLRTKEEADLGPILCVCYTNHALDQLLEHLLDNKVTQIVRIGSRSKSDRLEDCNLRKVAQAAEMTREEKHDRYFLKIALDQEEQEIQNIIFHLTNQYSRFTIKNYLGLYHLFHHDQLFEDYGIDEDGFETVDYQRGQEILKWLRGGHQYGHISRPTSDLFDKELRTMNHAERDNLFLYWIKDLNASLQDKLNTAISSHQSKKAQYDRIRDGIDLRCLQEANVIGVTTTGLARQLDLLRKLSSKVLVCEEAGEVLEAHVLTALLPSLEHAVLIGDHDQLRPQIQNYGLSRENPQGKQYSFDLSLFERLLRPTDISRPSFPFSVLETQRRMHPSISNLIRKTIYPQLRDSPHVEDYPKVCGMKKRLFWLDHREPEAGSMQDDAVTTSHSNDFEIEMAVALVTHLIRQGVYVENEIAVLTPYLGQMLKIRRVLSRSYEVTLSEGDVREIEKQGLESDEDATLSRLQPAKSSLLKSLKISTIDNFQGEEAKIVIVSLVRSNPANKCGFLKTSNRINVLLSRAKHGMYIIGNSATSCHVKMWADVIDLLRADDNIGTCIELQCPRHLKTCVPVAKPDDFLILSPEGGCNLKCDHRLLCGHACINKCHSELLHNAVVCLEDCPRSLKGCDHPCTNRCGERCITRCNIMKRHLDLVLPCGHRRNELRCWEFQNLSSILCKDIIKRIVPGCEHEVQVPCHFDMQRLPCEAKCGTILDCGHVCQRKCFECKTRENGTVIKQNHGSCQKVCERDYSTCTHSCRAKCHGQAPCPGCSAECQVSCSHSKCYKKCSEPCAPCAEETCTSSCPHQKCTMPCASPCNWLPCSRRCEKLLTCGHQCPTVCGELCPSVEFCQVCANEDVRSAEVDYIMGSTFAEHDLDDEPCIIPLCGHVLAVSSMDGFMEITKHYEMDGINCTAIKDNSDPYSMGEVKSCPKCRASLRNVSRYGRIVRRALIDQSSKRFIVWSRQISFNLEQKSHEHQLALESSTLEAKKQYEKRQVTVDLSGSRESQIKNIRAAGEDRYRMIGKTRNALSQHLFKVSVDEQPFKRVWDLVQNARRKNATKLEMRWDPAGVQVGESLRVQSLLFRCDLAIIADFLHISNSKKLEIGTAEAKQGCIEMIQAAKEGHLPLQEAEGHIFYARYCAMERSFSQDPEFITEWKSHIEHARTLCKKYPRSTSRVVGEVDEVETMLREATFYSRVEDDEWKEIMAAMRSDNIGTGHWYTCQNGHPFAIGECGRPMQETTCPECEAPVGGQHHQEAAGVRRATELEDRIDAMHL